MFIKKKNLDNITQRRVSPYFLNFAARCELQP